MEVAKARRNGLSPKTSKLGWAGVPAEGGLGEGEDPQAAMGVHPWEVSGLAGAAAGLGGGETTRSCGGAASDCLELWIELVWTVQGGQASGTGGMGADESCVHVGLIG